MKKFLASLLLFIGFASVFYIVGLVMLPKFLKPNLFYERGGTGYLYSRIQNIKSVKNVDILFLGSSHAYRGFDTRIFDSAGFKSFNLGSSHQTPIQSSVLVSKYLSQLNPKLIVYEVNPIQFNSDGVESAIDVISNDNASAEIVKMTVATGNVKAINTLIYSLYKQFLSKEKTFHEKQKQDKDAYIPGGFVERELEYFHPTKLEKVNLHMDQKQLNCLDQMLALLQHKGVKVILVQSPVTTSFYNSYSNKEQFDSVIQCRKVPYYNFNDLINLDDSLHFYDKGHLNQEGVKLFDAKLMQLIKKTYGEIARSN